MKLLLPLTFALFLAACAAPTPVDTEEARQARLEKEARENFYALKASLGQRVASRNTPQPTPTSGWFASSKPAPAGTVVCRRARRRRANKLRPPLRRRQSHIRCLLRPRHVRRRPSMRRRPRRRLASRLRSPSPHRHHAPCLPIPSRHRRRRPASRLKLRLHRPQRHGRCLLIPSRKPPTARRRRQSREEADTSRQPRLLPLPAAPSPISGNTPRSRLPVNRLLRRRARHPKPTPFTIGRFPRRPSPPPHSNSAGRKFVTPASWARVRQLSRIRNVSGRASITDRRIGRPGSPLRGED